MDLKSLSVQNINKKKIISVSLISVLMIAVITTGITLALLSKSTEKRANNFTFGNISIKLTEDEWDKLEETDKIIYPDKTLLKDPVITNIGNNSLYAYMEVKVPRDDVRTVSVDENGNEVVNDSKMQDLFTFEINKGWKLINDSEDDKYSVYLYVYETPLSPEESTLSLFDSVKFINILEGEIKMNTNIEMPVTAYAIQSEYCAEGDFKFKDIFDEYIGS